MSWAVFFTPEELDEQFAALSPSAVDIGEDPRIAATLARLRDGYPPGSPSPVPRVTPDRRRRVAVASGARAQSRTHDVSAALATRHDVREVPADGEDARARIAWADVVVADAATHRAQAAIMDAPQGLVLDLTGCDPGETDELLLLRGDLFLWPATHEPRWLERFAAAGRHREPRRRRPARPARHGGRRRHARRRPGRPAREVRRHAAPDDGAGGT